MICFDTSVLIWGVQGKAHPEQSEWVERTRAYLRKLSEENEHVLVPAPVMMEYLRGFDDAERPRQIEAVQREWLVGAFDMRCAALAATMWRDCNPGGGTEVNGTGVKMDFAIVATAVVYSCQLIVTHDVSQLTRIAGGRIDVCDVPEVYSQGLLL